MIQSETSDYHAVGRGIITPSWPRHDAVSIPGHPQATGSIAIPIRNAFTTWLRERAAQPERSTPKSRHDRAVLPAIHEHRFGWQASCTRRASVMFPKVRTRRRGDAEKHSPLRHGGKTEHSGACSFARRFFLLRTLCVSVVNGLVAPRLCASA
jgi:hypothetical protein